MWRTPYTRIGFDVTLVHSTNIPSSTDSEAAQYNICDLRLREGEKNKFNRATGGTNKVTKKTLTADEVIGEIIDNNNVFIPISVGPFGEFGTLFRRFLENKSTLPLPKFPDDRPNATRAALLAINHRTPYDILGKADKIWKAKYGKKLFDGSYLSQLPSNWANQRLGLATITHIANHVNASPTKIGSFDASNGINNPDDELDPIGYGDNSDWRFHDGNMGDNTHHDSTEDLCTLFDMEDVSTPRISRGQKTKGVT